MGSSRHDKGREKCVEKKHKRKGSPTRTMRRSLSSADMGGYRQKSQPSTHERAQLRKDINIIELDWLTIAPDWVVVDDNKKQTSDTNTPGVKGHAGKQPTTRSSTRHKKQRAIETSSKQYRIPNEKDESAIARIGELFDPKETTIRDSFRQLRRTNSCPDVLSDASKQGKIPCSIEIENQVRKLRQGRSDQSSEKAHRQSAAGKGRLSFMETLSDETGIRETARSMKKDTKRLQLSRARSDQSSEQEYRKSSASRPSSVTRVSSDPCKNERTSIQRKKSSLSKEERGRDEPSHSTEEMLRKLSLSRDRSDQSSEKAHRKSAAEKLHSSFSSIRSDSNGLDETARLSKKEAKRLRQNRTRSDQSSGKEHRKSAAERMNSSCSSILSDSTGLDETTRSTKKEAKRLRLNRARSDQSSEKEYRKTADAKSMRSLAKVCSDPGEVERLWSARNKTEPEISKESKSKKKTKRKEPCTEKLKGDHSRPDKPKKSSTKRQKDPEKRQKEPRSKSDR